MGYASALLSRDVSREQEELEKQASKKGMWGSIGRTLGGLAATAITGGAAAPWAVGLASGAGTLAGGAIGSQAAGGISKGKFFKSSREKLKGELDPFGAENITGALTSGLTAGMAQKAKMGLDISEAKSTAALAKDSTLSSISAAGKAREASYGGFDFYGSTVGGSKPIQGLLSKHRQSAWEAAGGTTAEADFGEWIGTPLDKPIRPQVSMAAEEPSRLMGLPRGETSGLDPFQMPSNMEPPAMLRPDRKMPSRIDIQGGKAQFGEQYPTATRGLQQENLLYDEWRKGLNFQGPQYAPPGDRWTRQLPSLGG